MAILKIARMGHPVLRQPAEAVHAPHHPEIQRLIADMIDTMTDAEGVGLAAPQVHVSQRIIVFYVPAHRADAPEGEATDAGNGMAEDGAEVPLSVLINPQFEPLDSRQTTDWEGCLSIPGLVGRVPRYRKIRYWGLDARGRKVVREAEGFHARVVQHECDHLDGVLYLERMEDISSLCFTSERGRAGGDEDPRPAPVGDVA